MTNNSSFAVCSVCKTEHPSTILNTKHRRCGGAKGAPRIEKGASKPDVRGVWSNPQ